MELQRRHAALAPAQLARALGEIGFERRTIFRQRPELDDGVGGARGQQCRLHGREGECSDGRRMRAHQRGLVDEAAELAERVNEQGAAAEGAPRGGPAVRRGGDEI
jgi:hypothetical protein